MTTREMYERVLGDKITSTRDFVRNGWEVCEVVYAADPTHTRLVWDAGEGKTTYPLVWDEIELPAGEAVVDHLREKVAREFDNHFLPGRTWAGPRRFNRFVALDPGLKRQPA